MTLLPLRVNDVHAHPDGSNSRGWFVAMLMRDILHFVRQLSPSSPVYFIFLLGRRFSNG